MKGYFYIYILLEGIFVVIKNIWLGYEINLDNFCFDELIWVYLFFIDLVNYDCQLFLIFNKVIIMVLQYLYMGEDEFLDVRNL